MAPCDDDEGNRTGKYSDASHTTPVEKYFWDHRNRLTKTELYVSGQLDKTVEYVYDHNNRMYSRIVDAASDSRQIFVRSGDQIVLELADDNVGEVADSDLTRRALWRPDTVDQLLAEEYISDDTYWMLTDHLGTVRDIVSYDSATDTTTLEQHNEFTSFGIFLNTPTITPPALYTGRFYDPLTQKQYNRERWYDLSTGRWMSVDPIGFEAGDVNLYRYVGNGATSRQDPTGCGDEYFVPGIDFGPDVNLEPPLTTESRFAGKLNCPPGMRKVTLKTYDQHLRWVDLASKTTTITATIPQWFGLYNKKVVLKGTFTLQREVRERFKKQKCKCSHFTIDPQACAVVEVIAETSPVYAEGRLYYGGARVIFSGDVLKVGTSPNAVKIASVVNIAVKVGKCLL